MEVKSIFQRQTMWIIIAVVLITAAARMIISPHVSYPIEYKTSNFPLIAQPDEISCGPTSCAMLLKYFNIEKTIAEIKAKAHTQWFQYKTEQVGMSTPEYLKAALEDFGLPCRLKQGSKENILEALNNNKPPLVLLRSGKQYWHYVVVIGYNDKSVIMADPGGGQQTVLSWETFEGAWDFSRDMDGEDCRETCPLCGGKGRYGWLPAPLGTCDFCGGQGKVVDIYFVALQLADVEPNTMIIPD